MQVSVRSNSKQFMRQMTKAQRSQLPFATARALTWTAKDAKVAVEKRIGTAFDRPTPYTQKAVATQPATKARQFSRVLIKDRQAEYLIRQEEGGTRTPKGTALVVPAGIRRNKYGNIARGGVRRLLARQDTFSGVIRGTPGIWQRTRAGGMKLLIAYEPKAEYKPRFKFAQTVEKEAQRAFPDNFERSFRDAVDGAR